MLSELFEQLKGTVLDTDPDGSGRLLYPTGAYITFSSPEDLMVKLKLVEVEEALGVGAPDVLVGDKFAYSPGYGHIVIAECTADRVYFDIYISDKLFGYGQRPRASFAKDFPARIPSTEITDSDLNFDPAAHGNQKARAK